MPTRHTPASRRRSAPPLRLLVFEDSVYWRQDQDVWTDQSFLWFVVQLASDERRVSVLGRRHPRPGTSHYRLPAAVDLVELAHYESLAQPSSLLAVVRSLRTAWSALGGADVVWLLGPHPMALLLAVLAPLRRARVVLGVRQDLPAYARHRHPGQRWTHLAADGLEAAWRALARRHPVVTVGPRLAAAYSDAPELLQLEISLMQAPTASTPERAARDDGRLQLLSVGRLEAEKNPLLLADVLARLRADDDRWSLVVCGDGPMREQLRGRLEQLGVADAAELRGYVPVHDGLAEVYRSSDAFLHVSWTEGVPQVLFEAWACGVPVVATDVGGVRDVAGDAAVLVPPGDAGAAADAVRRVTADDVLRTRLAAAARERATTTTIEAALDRLGRFLTRAADRDEPLEDLCAG